MNARAAALGLTHTHFNDTAGADAGTVSNPRDLFKLAVQAMKNPVIAKIVAETQADLPVAGIRPNVNAFLGQDGIVGIKTGSGVAVATGGPPLSNFVFASKQTAGGQPYVIYGAVMGQDTLADAFNATLRMIDAVKPVVQAQSVVAAGDVVASYRAPWGSKSDIRADKSVSYFSWPGLKITRSFTVAAVTAPVESGRQVGHLIVSLGAQTTNVPLTTGAELPEAGKGWRLTRIR